MHTHTHVHTQSYILHSLGTQRKREAQPTQILYKWARGLGAGGWGHMHNGVYPCHFMINSCSLPPCTSRDPTVTPDAQEPPLVKV